MKGNWTWSNLWKLLTTVNLKAKYFYRSEYLTIVGENFQIYIILITPFPHSPLGMNLALFPQSVCTPPPAHKKVFLEKIPSMLYGGGTM